MQWLPAVVACALVLAAGAGAEPGRPLRGALALLPALEEAARSARAGDPAAVQARYDRARDLVEAVRGAAVTAGCRPLRDALLALGGAHVAAAEAFDRQRPADTYEASIPGRRARVERTARPCRDDAGQLVRPSAPSPLSAAVVPPLRPSTTPRLDTSLARALSRAAAGFAGASGIWVQELATGRAAGWAAERSFPAASTVKLAVLVEALRRAGSPPRGSPLAHDLRALAAWSSNLAANRLVRLLGAGDPARGARAVERRLRVLGATASTYPGDYRVGTSRRAAAAARVTTPRDLARILVALHDTAAGGSAAAARSGLTRAQARVALALLLASRGEGDNRGLLRPALPARLPAAQKHGWISSARHTAAIVFAPRGAVVVVVMAERERLTLRDAATLGAAVLAAADLR
jgi:beta-lactamase class A